MANSFGSLWIGTSGLQSASHGLNTTSNNLSNVNTKGYVREQVVYEDRDYRKIGTASISQQQAGLGVQVGTIVHARDVFLDKAYRTESGRYSFYAASAEAVDEVQTHLQESDGEAFRVAVANFYEAFAEYAKDPSDTVNQNLVLQKASLFLSRGKAVNKGFEDYQTIINSKIKEDIDRINEIGKTIVELNRKVQAVEASHIEKAMDARDQRDLLLDELASLVRISYKEEPTGIVRVEIEGVEFIDEVQFNEIGLEQDTRTGFVTPYWSHLSDYSDRENPEYYPVFANEVINGSRYLSNVSATLSSDIGEVKALLMARGDNTASYRDFDGLDSDTYDTYIGNSIMMNSEAELDYLVHSLATSINDLYSPLTTFQSMFGNVLPSDVEGAYIGYMDSEDIVPIYGTTRIADTIKCDVGSDGQVPARELFVRHGCDRFTKQTIFAFDKDGNKLTHEVDGKEVPISFEVYVYNEEDPADLAKCYSLKSIEVNHELQEEESLLPYMNNFDHSKIDYDLGDSFEKLWNAQTSTLNPADTTPCSFREFYVKWVGEIGTTGSVYNTTAEALSGTREQIEYSRQGVIGVSSDEELTSMIKYQSAYNAASRYINVVNQMIEHLLNSLAS